MKSKAKSVKSKRTKPKVEKVDWESIKKQMAEDNNESMLFADGFDEALIGVCHQACKSSVAAYDQEKCIDILERRDGMSREDAIEYFLFNVVSAYVGENTPVFILQSPCN